MNPFPREVLACLKVAGSQSESSWKCKKKNSWCLTLILFRFLCLILHASYSVSLQIQCLTVPFQYGNIISSYCIGSAIWHPTSVSLALSGHKWPLHGKTFICLLWKSGNLDGFEWHKGLNLTWTPAKSSAQSCLDGQHILTPDVLDPFLITQLFHWLRVKNAVCSLNYSRLGLP